ncbi:Per1-like-domain-containing protein [Jimgerdemannia flammicorona]|uniref:Post-GPI attachment to proteins factor 3 n=1 Tax=Jimgerdemannia flammicorona TaxID=994334 RepID=A0A433QH86_9FUNG|nr:Per1-like-domain-containing protein [Jimgerdemannia flammicorona]
MRLCTLSTFFIILVLVFYAYPTNASAGDRDPEFIDCVSQCTDTICALKPRLPFTLLLTLWTCPQNCQYTCMQTITSAAKLSGQPIVQYFGKWPFYRLWGIQEPASVLFSLGNLYFHRRYWFLLRRDLPSSYPLRPHYLGWSLASINTWVWSSVFHTRDFLLTERLDYFSAALTILYALHFSVLRIFRIPDRSFVARAWMGLCITCYLAHVAYLSLIHFDYRYNAIAVGSVGVLHNVLWLGWSAWQYSGKARAAGANRSYAWYPTAAGVLISAAMGLEIFDFPPFLGVLDAHSLWHLATVPLIPLWYRFMIKDARFEGGRGVVERWNDGKRRV